MTKFYNGDEVRIKATGAVVTLEEINVNENYKKDNEFWAEASSSHGNYDSPIERKKEIELVRRKEDIPQRKLPTLKEVAVFLSGAAHHGFDEEISVSETDTNEPEGQFLLYGTSSSGQTFGCRVTISGIQYTDF